MLYPNKNTLWAFGVITLVLASGVSSAVNSDCSTKESQCQASCAAIGAQADFHCDLQGSTWAASCACASPKGGVAATPSPASLTSSPAGTPSPPPPPSQPIPPPSPTLLSPITTTSCDQQRKACAQSCPSGTLATVDCKQSSATGTAAVANSCVCAPLSSSPAAASSTPPTTPPVASTTLGQADGGQVTAASGPNQAPVSFALRPPSSLNWIYVS